MTLFFSLDGLDGVGKSTQMELLRDWLQSQGFDVVTCRDPGSTQVGEATRAILLERNEWDIDRTSEMFLYMAARSQLVAEVIRPALADGKLVLSDRFLLANVVYQGHAGGLSVDDLWETGRIATGGLMPTRTIVMDMEVADAMARIGGEQDRMESQGTQFFQRVRDGFLFEADRRDDVTVVDANRSIEDLHLAIVHELQKELAGKVQP